MSEQRIAGCVGKIRYPTYEKATRYMNTKNKLQAYKCKQCNGFHTGSNVIGKRPRGRQIREREPA